MNDSDLVAIVTGGSRGIGKAICKQFAKQGINVIVNYSSDSTLAEKTVDEICNEGGKAKAMKGSVANIEDVNRIVNDTLECYGKIDILINNAGILRDGMLFMMKESDWKEVISTNLIGSILFTQEVIKPMMKSKFGRIINVGSISGLIGTPGQTNYSTSKSALIGFTKSLAKEVALYNITVNAVALGYVETEMLKSINETKLQKYKDNIPLKRFATPEEIASNLSFLISKNADYITGQTIVIDGGVTIT